jgi:hypothetical protein
LLIGDEMNYRVLFGPWSFGHHACHEHANAFRDLASADIALDRGSSLTTSTSTPPSVNHSFCGPHQGAPPSHHPRRASSMLARFSLRSLTGRSRSTLFSDYAPQYRTKVPPS